MHSQIVLGITLFAAAALGSPLGSRAGGGAQTSSALQGRVKCPVVFDGRIPVATELTDLDKPNDFYFHDNVKGAGLDFSELLEFPAGPGSRFDGTKFKPVQVTISDASIFNNQTGFRRAELLFNGNFGKDADPSITGVMTMHWSVKTDSKKPLNRTHEYLVEYFCFYAARPGEERVADNGNLRSVLSGGVCRLPGCFSALQNVFRETADFSGAHFTFLAGTLLADKPEDADPDSWKVLNRKNERIFSTPIAKDVFQNFAVTLDMNANTLQVFASEGNAPLVAVTKPVPNDNSGGGQFHCGLLKKPTGTADVVKSGFQASGILEGLTYASVFVEDSAGGCVSL